MMKQYENSIRMHFKCEKIVFRLHFAISPYQNSELREANTVEKAPENINAEGA